MESLGGKPGVFPNMKALTAKVANPAIGLARDHAGFSKLAALADVLSKSHFSAYAELGAMMKSVITQRDAMTEEYETNGRKLTPQQEAFVLHFTSTNGVAGNAAEAARRAGYSEKNSAELGRQLLAKPHIKAAIDAALREAIGTRLTVQAVAVIGSILNDPNASLKLRGEMAVKIVEYSGLIERTKAEKAKQTGISGGGPLAQMTREELEAIVARGAAALQEAEEPVGGPSLPN